MMYVPDTHALVWYIIGDTRLGQNALLALRDPSQRLVIPTIVLAEIRYISARHRIPLTFEEAVRRIRSVLRGEIAPLDEEIIEAMPTMLEIHDAIICATALVYSRRLRDSAVVITRDEAITRSGLVQVVW